MESRRVLLGQSDGERAREPLTEGPDSRVAEYAAGVRTLGKTIALRRAHGRDDGPARDVRELRASRAVQRVARPRLLDGPDRRARRGG